MTKPLTHPLTLSHSYVKTEDKKRNPETILPKPIKKPLSMEGLSKKYNHGVSYFYKCVNPKRIRIYKLLGRGDIEAGYLKYLLLSKEVEKRLLQISKEMISRKKTLAFSKFLGKSPSYFSIFSKDVKTDGIKNATKLTACRKIIKQYKQFEKEKVG